MPSDSSPEKPQPSPSDQSSSVPGWMWKAAFRVAATLLLAFLSIGMGVGGWVFTSQTTEIAGTIDKLGLTVEKLNDTVGVLNTKVAVLDEKAAGLATIQSFVQELRAIINAHLTDPDLHHAKLNALEAVVKSLGERVSSLERQMGS